MAQYFLKLSGSNNIESIIEWDGVSSYTPPPGYVVELATTTASINYAPSASIYEDPVFGGKLFGQFEGDLTGSVTFNGDSLAEILSRTPYGTVTLYTSSLKDVHVDSGSFKISGSKLYLPLKPNTNHKYPYVPNYSSSFARIISGSVQNYVFTLQNESVKLDFLVKNTTLQTTTSASITNKYIELDVNNYFYFTPNVLGDGSFYKACSAGYYGPFDTVDPTKPNKIALIGSSDIFVSRLIADFQLTNFYVDFNFGSLAKDLNTAITATKRKKIYEYRNSDVLTVPSWADKITVYAIGAGGGGGGGASGYSHGNYSGSYAEAQSLLSSSSKEWSIGNEMLIGDLRNPFTSVVNGTPGNYTPRQDTWFGHEFVTGGGGGAGGCVAIDTIEGKEVVDARGSVLNITIGSGGKGGSGSSYFDDVVALEYSDSTNTEPYYKENWAWKIVETIYPKSEKETFPGLIKNSIAYPDFAIISPYGELYNGKPGGDTIVFLGSKKIAQAQGGNGGTAGFALKKFFNIFHRFCGIYDHQPSIVLTPGGANDGTTNLGSEISTGGPGGYGMSMPTVIQQTDNNGKLTYPSNISEKTFAANVAPDIPFKTFSPKKDIPGYEGSITYAANITNDNDTAKLPYGNITRVFSENLEYKRYERNGNRYHFKPAPMGGGGGVGASFQGLDQRNANIYRYEFLQTGTSNAFAGGQIPDDFFQKTSNLITGSITFGFGGVAKFNEYLIDDYDEDGINYRFPSGSWINYFGGNGGYDDYGINTDNLITEWAGNPVVNTPPSSGLYFAVQEAAGYGGGGGAGKYVLNYDNKYRVDNESLYPTRGQNGADGQAGLAIIVIEEL